MSLFDAVEPGRGVAMAAELRAAVERLGQTAHMYTLEERHAADRLATSICGHMDGAWAEACTAAVAVDNPGSLCICPMAGARISLARAQCALRRAASGA